jgi:hypothetical protein
VTADEDAISRECPRCGANPGNPCHSIHGKVREWPHVVRGAIEDQRQKRGMSVRALCCDCGQIREFNSRGHARKNDGNHSYDDGYHPDGWRMTRTLKCSTCNKLTRHAVLRDDDAPIHRDSAESRMTGCPCCPAGQNEPCRCPISGVPLPTPCLGRANWREPTIES